MLVPRTCSAIAEFEDASSSNEKDRAPTGSMGKVSWQAPSNGVYKATCDAALNPLSEGIGIGMVIRDQDGRVKVAQSSFCSGRFDPITAEALAAVLTLRFCTEVGLEKVRLEGDAKNVVGALNSLEANWSRIGYIAADAKVLLPTFTHWEVQYVSHDTNFAAHNLAKLAAQLGIKIVDCISEIIRV